MFNDKMFSINVKFKYLTQKVLNIKKLHKKITNSNA